VLSGQTFEHNPEFWRTLAEMTRVMAPHGVMVIIVPSEGPVHRYPVDCYRFGPDAMTGWATAMGLEVVEQRISPFGPWHDNIGVFRTAGFDRSLASLVPDLTVEFSKELQNSWPLDLPEEIEHGDGVEWKYDFLERLTQHLEPDFYFEIGVFEGASLKIPKCDALGIDPEPVLTEPLASNHRISHTTSDDFFHLTDEPAAMPTIDLAYIDGMHLAEFVLKDFMNVERYCGPCSVVMIDDIYPTHPLQAERRRQSQYWTGDVWKVIPILRGARPDLVLMPINTSPTGTLLIIGTDPSNDEVWKRYDVLADWILNSMRDVHPEILDRDQCFDPFDPLVLRVMQMLRDGRRAEREQPGAGREMVDRIRSLVAGATPRVVAP
jgi:hypothetical protein